MFGKTSYCNKCGSTLCVSSNKEKGVKHYWCKKCNSRLNEGKVEKAILEKLESIEAIYIDKIKGANQQDYEVVIKRVRFKQSRIMAFYKLINQGIIDSISAKANMYYNSLALIDKEEDIKNYIDKLRKKYKIKVDEITIRGDEPKRKNSLKRMDDFLKRCFLIMINYLS